MFKLMDKTIFTRLGSIFCLSGHMHMLNDGPRLTLTYLTLRSNLLPNVLNGNFFEKIIF